MIPRRTSKLDDNQLAHAYQQALFRYRIAVEELSNAVSEDLVSAVDKSGAPIVPLRDAATAIKSKRSEVEHYRTQSVRATVRATGITVINSIAASFLAVTGIALAGPVVLGICVSVAAAALGLGVANTITAIRQRARFVNVRNEFAHIEKDWRDAAASVEQTESVLKDLAQEVAERTDGEVVRAKNIEGWASAVGEYRKSVRYTRSHMSHGDDEGLLAGIEPFDVYLLSELRSAVNAWHDAERAMSVLLTDGVRAHEIEAELPGAIELFSEFRDDPAELLRDEGRRRGFIEHRLVHLEDQAGTALFSSRVSTGLVTLLTPMAAATAATWAANGSALTASANGIWHLVSGGGGAVWIISTVTAVQSVVKQNRSTSTLHREASPLHAAERDLSYSRLIAIDVAQQLQERTEIPLDMTNVDSLDASSRSSRMLRYVYGDALEQLDVPTILRGTGLSGLEVSLALPALSASQSTV